MQGKLGKESERRAAGKKRASPATDEVAMASSTLECGSLLHIHFQPRSVTGKLVGSRKILFFRFDALRLEPGRCSLRSGIPRFLTAARTAPFGVEDADGSVGSDRKNKVDLETAIARLQETVATFPPVAVMIKMDTGYYTIGSLFIAFALLVIVARHTLVSKTSKNQSGSVAYLVKRGQLRSDRRGISKPLKYEDPFNNPLVKKSTSNGTLEICGKVYRLAPVTLTKEQRTSHQKRRSRAYSWKRPTVFLKEGDEIPRDVDPDTIRWIPPNHPFATTVSDIDENLAQDNVYQKDGVPFQIRAEHEALQRKLEALQIEQKLNKVAIAPNNFSEFEMPSNPAVGRKEQDETKSDGEEHGQHIRRSNGLLDSSGSKNLPLSQQGEPL